MDDFALDITFDRKDQVLVTSSIKLAKDWYQIAVVHGLRCHFQVTDTEDNLSWKMYTNRPEVQIVYASYAMGEKIAYIKIDLTSIQVDSYDQTLRVRNESIVSTFFIYRAFWFSIYKEQFEIGTGLAPFSFDIEDPKVKRNMEACGVVLIE